jgi:hypothetical protein
MSEIDTLKETIKHQAVRIAELERMLKLDNIPLVEGGWSGWAYMNTPKPKEEYKGLPKDDDLEF